MNDGKNISRLNAPIIFNIGYEKHTIQTLIKRLRRYKISVLVDLRSRPYSRNPDFIKQRLQQELANYGIKYLWRGKGLGGFGVSRKKWRESLKEIAELAQKEKVCLMCMEANINQCHRKELAEMLVEEYEMQSFNL